MVTPSAPDDNRRVCDIELPDGSTGIDAAGNEAAANALLIAAAPDLLAALVLILKEHPAHSLGRCPGDKDGVSDCCLCRGLAAIAKAKGQP